ncbi:LysM peptidoglycan-binding domain-containing protein [bacterium]|nr:LysM peptidoglycan-binding domain-containing protein [bacterium]
MRTIISRLIAIGAMTFVLAAAGCGGGVSEKDFKALQKQSADNTKAIKDLGTTAIQLDSRIEDIRTTVETMQKDLKLVSTDVAGLASKGGGSPEANKALDQRLRSLESGLQKLNEQIGSRPARSEDAVEPQDAQSAEPATPKPGARVRRSTPAQAPAFTWHLIKQGETLDSIARNYGTSADAIRKKNNIPAGKSVPAGNRIMIPKS